MSIIASGELGEVLDLLRGVPGPGTLILGGSPGNRTGVQVAGSPGTVIFVR